MPRTPPRSVILASCVPEPPDDEVLEWTPTEDPSILRSHSPSSVSASFNDADARDDRSPSVSASFNDADAGEELEPPCPVCSNSGKLLDDPCPLCDGVERPLTPASSPHTPAGEDNVIEFNNVELTAEEKLKYDQVDITMDSGAGAPVANPKDFPGCEVTDSPGSLAGQMFVGPDGSKIANEGQFDVKVRLDDGRITKSTYQAVEVRKPLMAVSSVNDKGNLVLFDEKGSFIIPGTNKDLISRLRALVKQAPDKVELHRKNGIFHMKAWKLKPGFTRQAR